MRMVKGRRRRQAVVDMRTGKMWGRRGGGGMKCEVTHRVMRRERVVGACRERKRGREFVLYQKWQAELNG